MIWINGTEVSVGKRFPCGELNLEAMMANVKILPLDTAEVTFKYSSDEDLLSLFLVSKHKKLSGYKRLKILCMPYARMDRGGYDSSSCSLRHVADLIKSLNYDEITVVDPHSDLTLAYLGENAKAVYPFAVLPGEYDVIMFPDSGAQKRYGSMDLFKSLPQVVGSKVRDVTNGKILYYNLSVSSILPYGRRALIVDDLCSYGGTFVHAGNALGMAGAWTIDLLVSHCEYSIFNGELLKEGSIINKVFTTDSLLETQESWPISGPRLNQLVLDK